MATGDVASLYTNIDHDGTLDAVRWALDSGDCSMEENLRDFILKCLEFCLQHNFFWYYNRFYLQTKGIAMGAKFAPSVANLYMAKREAEGVLGEEHVDIMLYKRFIDDLLIIWKGSMESLMGLLEPMNNNDQNISLTWNISRDSIHFF